MAAKPPFSIPASMRASVDRLIEDFSLDEENRELTIKKMRLANLNLPATHFHENESGDRSEI